MPDCAPKIYYKNKDYVKGSYPNNRKWHVESDYDNAELAAYISNIKSKASGQEIKTFLSGHWTLEYELAFYGLKKKRMRECLIHALTRTVYDEFSEKNTRKIIDEIDKGTDIQEQATYFYRKFRSNSKAEFAQYLSVELESEFNQGDAEDQEELKRSLPSYLVKAITYVTERT
jgi:putative ATP-dependent endonuclease of OLD family